MTKYDCSIKEDFVHERKRMCEHFTVCDDCPLNFVDGYCQDVDNLFNVISTLQKWSDTHEENPILTRKERAFIETFENPADTYIVREWTILYIKDRYDDNCESVINIYGDLFPFINDGESLSIENLLNYDVEGK